MLLATVLTFIVCKIYFKNRISCLLDPGKTLMVLEGCAEPHLGCCILLRGASLQELIRVKKVVKFMLLACYNWKLEKSFLGDIEAILPEPGMTFNDESDTDVTATFELSRNNQKSKEGLHGEDNETDTTAKELAEADVTKMSISNKDESVSNDKLKTSTEGINEKLPEDNDVAEKDKERLFVDLSSNNSPNNDSLNDDKIFCNFDNKVTAKIDTAGNGESLSEDEKTTDTEVGISEHCIKPAEREPKPFTRKADSDKTFSCGVPIRDFSDPLRSTLSVDDEVFLPKEAELKADIQTNR